MLTEIGLALPRFISPAALFWVIILLVAMVGCTIYIVDAVKKMFYRLEMKLNRLLAYQEAEDVVRGIRKGMGS